jgi:hypothetical protein
LLRIVLDFLYFLSIISHIDVPNKNPQIAPMTAKVVTRHERCDRAIGPEKVFPLGLLGLV